MPKFSVWATVRGTKFIGEFDANTAEHAIELAGNSDAANVGLCHQCSSECENPECDDFVAELTP